MAIGWVHPTTTGWQKEWSQSSTELHGGGGSTSSTAVGWWEYIMVIGQVKCGIVVVWYAFMAGPAHGLTVWYGT